MGEANREWHQFFGFVYGIPEHHTLVAGTLLVVFLAFGGFGVNALGYVWGLLVQGDQDGATLVVELQIGVHVADVLDGVAGNLLVVDYCLGGDFTGNHDETRVHQSFAGYTAFGVLGKTGVEDGVRNLVANFVWVSFGHGFRGKKIVCH